MSALTPTNRLSWPQLHTLVRRPDTLFGLIGGFLLLLVVASALFAPLLTPYEPEARVGIPFQPPSNEFRLGTDDFGHDIFSQLTYGARLSLTIGLVSTLLAVGIGLKVSRC